MRLTSFVFLICSGIAGCASTEVFHTDLTRQAGVYVLGYTTDVRIRQALETQLVAALGERDIMAWPSHADLPELAQLAPGDIIAAATRHQAVGVILVNEVAADASDSIVENPQRVTPLHPDLQAYFQESRDELIDDHATDTPVFAEVNLFLLDGDVSRLFWSGTTWSFHADGQGTALRGISTTIADQLAAARASFTHSPLEK